MADYIDREKLLVDLERFAPECRAAFLIIEKQEAVDALEAVHGRWIAVPSSDMMTGKAYKCSECGKMRYGSFMPNYCAICGAKMDLEVE